MQQAIEATCVRVTGEALKAVSGWKQNLQYTCKECKGVARVQQDGEHLWGCDRCGYTTRYPSAHFNRH